MSFTSESVADLLALANFEVTAQCSLPARIASYKPIPAELEEAVKRVLELAYPGGLFEHQADALRESISGADICLAKRSAERGQA
jgi:hypothetical protein